MRTISQLITVEGPLVLRWRPETSWGAYVDVLDDRDARNEVLVLALDPKFAPNLARAVAAFNSAFALPQLAEGEVEERRTE